MMFGSLGVTPWYQIHATLMLAETVAETASHTTMIAVVSPSVATV